MIFSIIDLLCFVAFIPFGFWVRFKIADTINSRLIFQYCQLAAFFSFCLGISHLAATFGNFGVSLFFARLSFTLLLASSLMALLLCFSFPYERQSKILRFLLVLAWAGITYVVFFSGNYISGMRFEGGLVLRSEGPQYHLFNLVWLAIGVAAALLLFLRRFFFKSMIYRLQSMVVVAMAFIGFTVCFALVYILPVRLGISWVLYLLPLGIGLVAGGFAYSMNITRLFNIKDAMTRTLSFVLYSAVLALAAGIGYVLLARPLNTGYSFLAFIIALTVYVAVFYISVALKKRFETLLRSRGQYGEALEKSLTEIDFSQGRDQVITTFLTLLRTNIDCTSVNLLVENQQGELVNVGSTNGKTEGFEIHVPGIELLLNNDTSIVLKTEIVTNYEYHEVKDGLLSILEAFDGDSLILLREGRAIIGAVILGARRTGGDFTDYDYDVLSKLYGKFFVVTYYLKNVAQESLVMTVDRELEFSEQIIQSIQENIDRIEYPGVDISYLTRSTRKLGGDFIDLIRLSQDRFIFVLGDVSGKGLNASMSMVILKSVIRTFLKETKDFKRLVVKTNAFIKTNLPKGTFFAGIFGLFDFKERSLYYVNCGVPAMFLLSSSYNNPVEIQGDGKVLGFVKDITPHVKVRKASFKPGDILLTTTDGLTDAESLRGVRFGKERIQASLIENRVLSAERIVRFLSESAEEFVSQELSDDITILAVKFAENKE